MNVIKNMNMKIDMIPKICMNIINVDIHMNVNVNTRTNE